MDYLTVEQAINAKGLRLVLTAGVPGPWGESAKAIFDFKGLAFTPVFQEGGGDNIALQQWTGQNSAPVAAFEDLPPVSHWLDLLMLAERLAPEKPLLPSSAKERADAVGLCALIAGVDGFAWHRRLQILAPMLTLPEPPPMIVKMGKKYGWSDSAASIAAQRMHEIASELDARLAAQNALGHNYFVGNKMTAVDIYWANFVGMLKPLGPEDNPMPDYMRASYSTIDEHSLACITPLLEAHRDMMYARHLTLPLDF